MTRNLHPTSATEIHRMRRRFEDRLAKTGIVVALLGAGGRGLRERRCIAATLLDRGIVPLIPEDRFPRWVSPTLAEELVLSDPGVDLVFLRVGSWGSAAELGQLRANPTIAPKLRIPVPPEYHPLHGNPSGYLADTYLTHLAVYGHVYATDGLRAVRLPTAGRLILMLAERFRQVRAIQSGMW